MPLLKRTPEDTKHKNSSRAIPGKEQRTKVWLLDMLNLSEVTLHRMSSFASLNSMFYIISRNLWPQMFSRCSSVLYSSLRKTWLLLFRQDLIWYPGDFHLASNRSRQTVFVLSLQKQFFSHNTIDRFLNDGGTTWDGDGDDGRKLEHRSIYPSLQAVIVPAACRWRICYACATAEPLRHRDGHVCVMWSSIVPTAVFSFLTKPFREEAVTTW